jgi:hypothetical protein
MQTLNDLKESFQIYAVCVDCQRMSPMNLDMLIERFGEQFPVTDLRAKVRCSSCERRTQDLRIVYVGPRSRPTGFRYQR